MDDNKENEAQSPDQNSLQKALFSNSTKRRVAELHTLRHQLEDQDLSPPDTRNVLQLLFHACSLYSDQESHRATQEFIRATVSGPNAEDCLEQFISSLRAEISRPNRRPADLKELVNWCSVLLQEFSTKPKLWRRWGLEVSVINAIGLEACLGSTGRKSVKQSSLVTSRRGLRKLFKTDSLGTEALDAIVKALTAKSASSSPRYAVYLGVVAGVSARLPEFTANLELKKKDYYDFYAREILSSRTVLPPHIGNGLHDFFEAYASLEDFRTQILPALEKSLLRSPEVVLSGIAAPLATSLPESLDFSEILHKNLLKPLLSNIKSTNASVRTGALVTFQALAFRSKDDGVVEKVADELLNPLKQGKVPAAEQRVLHAQMLLALKGSTGSLLQKALSALPSLVAKEANEAALAAETKLLAVFTQRAFIDRVQPESAVADAFAKGVSDKKVSVRKLWALRAGELLWELNTEQLNQTEVLSFIQKVLGKLADTFTEILSNPLPAAQSGLATIGYIFTALVQGKLSHITDNTIQSLLKKSSVPKQVLIAEPKPSFLLNHRVYSKLTSEDDLVWVVRAYAVIARDVSTTGVGSAVSDAWSQAFLYFVSAADLPFNIPKEATAALARVHTEQPSSIGKIMVKGLWHWLRRIELNYKDSAAATSKAGNTRLGLAVRSICLTPTQASAIHASVDQETIREQLLDLLILCRPGLIPGSAWIETCLRVSVDPGELVTQKLDACKQRILETTEDAVFGSIPAVKKAAYEAAVDLAFVAPEAAIPMLINQIRKDLDPHQLDGIGPTEAAIFRTPEGTVFVDVLASGKGQNTLHKSAKDYDTLKWEDELRTQLAQKKGQSKKLTADEQAKVNAQLAKEANVRRNVSKVEAKMARGVGIVHALATGPPTEAGAWMGTATGSILDAVMAGAEFVLGSAAAMAYLACAERVSPRLGPMRTFIGVATLRATGKSVLPAELEAEPLQDLVTRVLYRLRFMGEQRPLDEVSVIYILPLIFLVLEGGGIACTSAEDADEQIVLALEVLSFHADLFSSTQLPREKLLTVLISSLQRFTQHYKLVKDCFMDLCRGIASNVTDEEISILARGSIVPEVPVRTAVLQAIDEEIDLTGLDSCEEVWLECHDDFQENIDLATAIWEESGFEVHSKSALQTIPYLEVHDAQLRRAAARALAQSVSNFPDTFHQSMEQLLSIYREKAKTKAPERDEFGIPRKADLADPWQARHGVALAFKELAPVFQPAELVSMARFLVEAGPLGDRNVTVRDAMIDAAVAIISARGHSKVEELMHLFETALENPDRANEANDTVNEAVIILYGALARHLNAGDTRVPKVVQRLLDTLSTPSETVQYAVAECLPPLVQASSQETSAYIERMTHELLNSKKYAARRGAAYGLAGIIRGRGIIALKDYRIVSNLKAATENKKDQNQRQGVFLAYELLALILGRIFEPYVIQIVPQLLAGFGDTSADVREACLDAAKTCFANLSSFGVQQVLPTLLDGLDESQWRSKKGACDSLGAMAYLDPQQLALSLPEIIPPLTTVLNDSHKEVRTSAKRSLQRFGEVISNPEIKSVVDVLLKALSDPTKHTDDALDSLIKLSFTHYLDAPSLALVVRILERGLGDRSATKRKASQIIGSLAHLTERKDLIAHLPILVAGLKVAIVDPVPTTRATASKALGSTIEKLGEDALPDLIPSLMATLKSDALAGDRLGSAQALSEVLAGLGTTRLEETLPTILQNVSSSKPSVREGFMSLFIFLPACFGNSFANHLSKIIPPILAGLADDVDTIRETSLRAGRLLVKNFATRAIDLLLPELERGLADDSHRIRLSSVELVGDLLFNLTGISGKSDEEEPDEDTVQAGQSLLEALGEEKRNKVLSALYICRCDTSGLVRSAAITVWKALVSTPRTLRELVPTLTQLLIRRLASSNMEQKVIAGNALGELIRKAGEGVLATLLPTLEEGLQNSTDSDARQGICIALRELITSASPDSLEDYEKTLMSVIRTALVDPDADVREAAAEAFDSLQRVLGKKAVDQVLPYLLNLLRSEQDAQNALSALLTLLTDHTRSNIILPTLLPTLLTSPVSAFNAKALASLAEVASSAMTRRLPNILNALMDNIVRCKDPDLLNDLDSSFSTILLSVDEYDGLNTAMSILLALVKHDDHRKRASADMHLAKFFAAADIDISRYHPDLIRALLVSFADGDQEVVKAAWTALSELTKRLKKEEMESLVISTRQVLTSVGMAGANLPGFSLPKGINAILPIFLQGLMNGTAEQRTQSAMAISDIIDRTSSEALKPFVTQITGPLIRVVSERSVDVKAAILYTLNNLLEKIPTFLKPFLPQLQRTFAKSLADPSSEILRTRAAKALGTLITMTPRVDPLIAELVTGSKTPDAGVKNAMFKALYEVVSKAGSNMNEASRTAILGLIDSDVTGGDNSMVTANARLLGALIKNLPPTVATNLIQSRVLTTHFTMSSVLALNAILLERPESLTEPLGEKTLSVIQQGITSNQADIQESCILAAGKYFLTPSSDKSDASCRKLLEPLSTVVAPGNPANARRLALVVLRTVSRTSIDLVRPQVPLLAPPVFASVRDPIIPIKLSAEAAFLALFDVVEEEAALFDKYMEGPGKELPPGQRRAMSDYFKRVAMRLGAQARERKEAEGGQGGLGLSSDEVDDEREVWSVGRVDLGEGGFGDD